MESSVISAEALPTFLIEYLEAREAYWKWDNHANLAMLASERVSDTYINCTPIVANPCVVHMIVEAMAKKIRTQPELRRAVDSPNCWFIGSAYGSITLAHMLGFYHGVNAGFAEKCPGDDYKTMTCNRFDFGRNDASVILVEDVVTTEKTLRQTRTAVYKRAEKLDITVNVCPIALSIFERIEAGGYSHNDPEVQSIAQIHCRSWEYYDNDSKPEELRGLAGVYPKRNWEELQRKKR